MNDADSATIIFHWFSQRDAVMSPSLGRSLVSELKADDYLTLRLGQKLVCGDPTNSHSTQQPIQLPPAPSSCRITPRNPPDVSGS